MPPLRGWGQTILTLRLGRSQVSRESRAESREQSEADSISGSVVGKVEGRGSRVESQRARTGFGLGGGHRRCLLLGRGMVGERTRGGVVTR